METRGAVLRKSPGEWEIVKLDLGEPRQGELILKVVASGLCHSDDHYRVGDQTPPRLPFAGGHEGAGVVVQVGPNTPDFEVGDHVILSFLGSCGRCRWCASGMQNLCDMGKDSQLGSRPDGSMRISLDGKPVAQFSGVSSFCEYTIVDVRSCIKVDKSLPLETVCLLGCGVGTGWGSAVNAAEVRPGQTIIVMGAGGVGMNAVQGAAHAGASHIIAVDPVPFKLDIAKGLGATQCFTMIEEATEFARSVTNGQGADSAVVTVGVLKPEHVKSAFSAVRKAGTVVVTAVGPESMEISVPAFELTIFQKRLQGALFGQSSPNRDIPWMVQLYRTGQLRLDELITTRYTLEQVNEAYADMHAGKNIRGVIIHKHS
jgi:S-(hydroxymethyl)glutathione dehydrogenase/alcohol dehydrogenase